MEFSTSAGVVRAIDGVSFDVRAGETVAILGESGSGKSVTAQAIMALLPKPAGSIVGGRILYRGRDLVAEPVSRVRELCGTEIAMVFQDPLSSLNRSSESVADRRGVPSSPWHTQAGGVGEGARAAERVGIQDAESRIRDYPHQFSGGQRQRIMIAMAIALEPELLIGDEPTTALDVTVQKQVMTLLADLQAETGMGMILISHDLGVVADVADRAAIMYAGRIVETGVTREVYDHPAHPVHEGPAQLDPQQHVDRPAAHPRRRLAAGPACPPAWLRLPSALPVRHRAVPDQRPAAARACGVAIRALRGLSPLRGGAGPWVTTRRRC